MTRSAIAALTVAVLLAPTTSSAEPVQMAGMRSELPEGWKTEQPDSAMRLAQFTVPGDKGAAEVVIFKFPGGSGTVEQNFERQQKKFEPATGSDKIDVKTGKIKVGEIEADYQDVTGTYLDKFPPFAPNPKVTRKEDYRQLYVVFKASDGEYYVWMQGPSETVKANKDAFEGWLKNFK